MHITTQQVAETTHQEAYYFASIVQDVANDEATKRVGRRAYISDIWRRLKSQAPSWTFEDFAIQLVQANTLGELGLSRADLVLDRAEEKASEITYLNATFHFVDVQ